MNRTTLEMLTFPSHIEQEKIATYCLGIATAASLFLLYQASSSFTSKAKKNTRAIPRSTMGILETIRMVASPNVPFKFLEMAKDLDSWIYELNLPVPGHPKVVVIAEAEDVRKIFKDDLSRKPHTVYGNLVEVSPTKNPTLVAVQAGDEWHRRKKGTSPAFCQKHIRRMNSVALKQTETWLQEFVSPLADANQKDSFDVAEQMGRLILKAFCETALEYDLSDEEIDSFITEWDLIAREYVLKSGTNPFRKYLTRWLPERRRAAQSCLAVHELAHRIIQNYRRLGSTATEGTVIDLIMKNPTYKDDHQIATEVFGYMVAGYDTTAFSLSWILMELGKNPHIQRSLREELSKVAPDDWSKMDFLKNVVKEGMRLHPVAAVMNSRTLGRDVITKKGNHFLPKGTLAFMPFYLIFRNKEIFQDPDTYKPSRWENPTETMKSAFIPFAAGKQQCIGQSLAKAEVHCIIARMIHEYEFSIEEEGHGEFHLVFGPVGLRMTAKRATPY